MEKYTYRRFLVLNESKKEVFWKGIGLKPTSARIFYEINLLTDEPNTIAQYYSSQLATEEVIRLDGSKEYN